MERPDSVSAQARVPGCILLCSLTLASTEEGTVHFQRLYCVLSLHLLSRVKASAINRSFVFPYCRLGRCLRPVHFLLRAAAALPPPTPPLIIEADRTRPSGSLVYKRSTLFVPSCAGQALLALDCRVVSVARAFWTRIWIR